MQEFYDLPVDERISLARQAAADRVPLMLCWSHIERPISDRWAWRAEIAADWLKDVRSIAHVGCGNMNLERYLSADQIYIPLDMVRRDERTIVIDLNTDDVPPICADAAVVLGVLEYLLDVPGFLTKLRRHFARVIVSYVHGTDAESRERLAMGWINHFDCSVLRRHFDSAGYAIVRDRALRNQQHLFHYVEFLAKNGLDHAHDDPRHAIAFDARLAAMTFPDPSTAGLSG